MRRAVRIPLGPGLGGRRRPWGWRAGYGSLSGGGRVARGRASCRVTACVHPQQKKGPVAESRQRKVPAAAKLCARALLPRRTTWVAVTFRPKLRSFGYSGIIALMIYMTRFTHELPRINEMRSGAGARRGAASLGNKCARPGQWDGSLSGAVASETFGGLGRWVVDGASSIGGKAVLCYQTRQTPVCGQALRPCPGPRLLLQSHA